MAESRDRSDDTAAGTDVPTPARSVEPTGEPSPFDPPGPQRRFIEAAELGRGGMGRVFEAFDSGLDRPVAIKQSLSDDPSILARFEREVRITAKLQHPGIVPILDAGRDGRGRPYYVMRRIDGRPLAEAIGKATTLESRLALVPNVLAAVDACAYAHSRNVIHRDIKPWNVLIAPFGETLLIDWGLARELDTTEVAAMDSLRTVRRAASDLTQIGETYGTPGFMPPEQAAGESIDRRADVFALGATLLHVLTGIRPSETPDPDEALRAIEVPAELRAIVVKAMAARRFDRYDDAGALAEDLRRFTTGQLVAAHRYTTRELIARWLRRHRIAIGIAATALIVLAVVGVIAVRRVLAAKDKADAAALESKQRADDVVVEHAKSLLPYDATRAAAMLHTLTTESPAVWHRVTAVLDSALARGVARGRVVHDGARFARLAVSPDGDAVVSVGTEGGVLLHDPELLVPARRIATVPDANVPVWVDRQRLVVIDTHGTAYLVSLDGATRVLESGISSLVGSGGGRVYVIDSKYNLRELDLGGGVQFAPVANIHSARRVGDALVYVNLDEAFYQRDGQTAVSLGKLDQGVLIERSHDQQKFAITSRNQVVEWNLASGAPVESGRWTASSMGLVYVTDTLFAHELNGSVWLRAGKPPVPSSVQFGFMSTAIEGAPCAYTAGSDGGLWQLCLGFVRKLSGRNDRIMSLARARDRVLGITASGRLFSWSTTASTPALRTLPRGFRPYVVAAGRVWNQLGEVQAVDLETNAATRFGIGQVPCRGNKHLVYTSREDDATYAIDLVTLEKVRFGAAELQLNCSRQDGVVTLAGRRAEIRDLSNPMVVIKSFELPFAVRTMHYEGNWVVAASNEGEVVRFDVRNGEMAKIVVPPPALIAIDHRGRVALAYESDLALWNPEGPLVRLRISSVERVIINPVGIVAATRDRTLHVIPDDGTSRVFHLGSGLEPSISPDVPFATMAGLDGDVAFVDLRDGRIRLFPGEAFASLVALEGRSIMTWTSTYAGIWKVPRDRTRAESIADIERATNAQVLATSTVVTFPD